MRKTHAGKAEDGGSCPVYAAIQILQEKWVLHIVHALLDGPRGFNELGRAVGGCNPTTLAQRLSRLEALGLIEKNEKGSEKSDAAPSPTTSSTTSPTSSPTTSPVAPRGCYALTPAGEGLQRVIDAIHGWAHRHRDDLPWHDLA